MQPPLGRISSLSLWHDIVWLLPSGVKKNKSLFNAIGTLPVFNAVIFKKEESVECDTISAEISNLGMLFKLEKYKEANTAISVASAAIAWNRPENIIQKLESNFEDS